MEHLTRMVKEMRIIDADKDCAYLNTANAIDKAIEIVKRGGRDEE